MQSTDIREGSTPSDCYYKEKSMRLDEIKIETLKLMFASANDIITVDNIEQYKIDEQYKVYLNSMNGSINRCLADIERKRVLQPKTYALNISDAATANESFVKFNLSELIQDYNEVDRVIYETAWGEYNGNTAYKQEGNILVLPLIDDGEYYTVCYRPKIPRVSASTEETAELPIPDEIAAVVPYYIKGDLFREDEPREASEARNWYESAMEQLYYGRNSKNKENNVKSEFNQREL